MVDLGEPEAGSESPIMIGSGSDVDWERFSLGLDDDCVYELSELYLKEKTGEGAVDFGMAPSNLFVLPYVPYL